MEEKLKNFCKILTEAQQEYLRLNKLDCEANLHNAIATYKVGNKYTKVDTGRSGKYMVDNITEEIYGIKAYGVIHKGHFYGTLDTLDLYDWRGYKVLKK